MAKTPEELLDNIARAVEESVALLLSRLPEAKKEIRSVLVSMLEREIGVTSDDVLKSTLTNAQTIKTLNKYFDKAFGSSSEYGKAVKEFIADHQRVAEVSNDYFAFLSSSFEASRFSEALGKSVIDVTLGELMGAGIDARFRGPALLALTESLSNKSSLKAAERAIMAQIDDQLTRYVKQVARDSLNTYTRVYITAVSEDLGLTHYLYKGTIIDDTRPFCNKRAGKVFTKAQVQSWGNTSSLSKSEQQGRIPGTDKFNIFTRCGGYNCRHFLVPITETLYNARNGA